MKELSEREVELPDAMIGKLQKIASESKDIISLGPGEPDFLTPKPILKFAKKSLKNSTHYTAAEGMTELREAISKKLKKDNKIKLSKDNILVSTGSQSAIFFALLSTLDPGDQVVLPNPSYLGYVPAIDLVNATPVYVRVEEENKFEINPDDIKKAIDKKKTRVIILNSPSNPTGNVIRKKILEEVADIAVDNDVYVFSDEAYEKIVYNKKHHSIGSLNGMKDYVLTFQTFSKSYAMAGFRLGYAAGPKELIDAMAKTSHYITVCPPHISQLAGINALSMNTKHIDKMVNEYQRRRDFIVKRLNDIGLPTVNPDGAFYAFSNIQSYSKNSVNFAKKLIKDIKVATVPGSEFGKFGEGYLRFSYATDYKLIKKAMERLENYLKKK